MRDQGETSWRKHLPSPKSSRFPPITPPRNANPAPREPQSWTWTCHRCGQRYPIGATRRCLNDGHRMCVGRRGHRGPACITEFDYNGWAAYGAWRRRDDAGRGRPSWGDGTSAARNCARRCDYPAECLWDGAQQQTRDANERLHSAAPVAQRFEQIMSGHASRSRGLVYDCDGDVKMGGTPKTRGLVYDHEGDVMMKGVD